MDQQAHLREFLTAVRRRWFADEALRVIGLGAAAASVPALCGLAVYWLLGPAGGAFVLLGGLTVLASIAAAAATAGRMQKRPDDSHVARYIEERAARLPGVDPFDDALVTAVGSNVAADAAFRPLLVSAAVKRLSSTSPSQIVPAERLRTAALQAAGGLVLLGTTLAIAVAPLGRAIETAWILFYPNALRVEVVPGDARVLAGQPVALRAVVRAGHRVFTRLVPSLTVEAGREQRTVPMAVEGEGFAFAFESVDRTFRYRVTVGAAVSQAYTVTALFPPRVERIELRYEYPSFTGLRSRDDQDGGDLYGPAGTRVRVRVHTDKPVASGAMVFARGARRPFAAASERVLEGDLVLSHDDSYRLTIADRDGLAAVDGTEYFIRLMDDRPPDVRIMRPAGDQQITPLEEVAIEARAEDDYGIASLELVYSVPGGQTRVVPFGRTSGTDVVQIGAHVLEAEELGVRPGDVITYYARARDVGRGKRPTEARSDMYFLEVRPFGEEFVAAESQAGGGASSQQLESLIAAQKDIINATWNIERRSGAGRSAADVRAVAQAQAELKARAEHLSAPRSRGRFQMPQQVRPSGPGSARQTAGDPIAGAIQAMGRAVEQLQGERTTEALPHEMAALQALLQAQAEVRRREVMQQAGGGSGGGSGRPGEDLSALFDKELQRQQRTNYETRSQIEERPDQQNRSEALDRIRDLARRQEEVNRQLRELAEAQASEEERKRQLERLTREQEQIREQLEQVARQSGAQRGEQSASKGSAQREKDGAGRGGRPDRDASGASGQMKSAAENMRGAAGSLERDDLKAAAEEAGRAAERLRDVERQMRGDSPEARRRAAGELQLEAQQIAQEQRRIAAEAGRLDKGEGDGNADARRRLSGEKDQLANRVDALQRGATELAKGQEQSAVAGAARELERQQIGPRMRDSARQLREGREGAAAAERQIADALDRVVRQFGAEGTPAGDRGALDETRSIRDRLDTLERQMAEAGQTSGEGRGQGRGAGEGGGRGGGTDANLARLREEYARALQQARETLSKMQQSAPRSGAGGSTPEKHEWSQADPGTQGFKQDFSEWESLRKDINLALERTEAAVSAQAARDAARNRLSAGGSTRVPDEYQKLIARYFESLARPRR